MSRGKGEREPEKESKAALRKEALRRRTSLSATERAEKSGRIARRLLSLPAYREASVLLLYAGAGSEVQTGEIFAEALRGGKKVCFPRVCTAPADGGRMEFYEIKSKEEYARMECSAQGIPEPPKDKARRFGGVPEGERCLLVMPGVAFDEMRGRIGYGGGYYDRFLARFPGLQTVALAYEAQLFDRLPVCAHDVRPGCLITEQRAIV